MARAVFAGALLVGCSGPETVTPEPPTDPFEAGETFALLRPGRSLAVTRVAGTTAAFVAREFDGDVLAVKLDGGAWTELGATPVPAGPRAICADGATAWVASTSARSLTRLGFDGASLTVVTSLDSADPPVAVACADLDGDGTADVLAASGQGDAAHVALLSSAAPPAVLFDEAIPSASFVLAADLDDDGDLDAIVLSTATATLTVLQNDDGTLSARAPLALSCAAPRAAAAFHPASGATRLAVACDGALLVVRSPLSDAPTVETAPADATLYGVVSGPFVDGHGDGLAAVSIATHDLTLRLGSDAAVWARHPVARGPIALAAFDVEGDGDLDLVVLSLEQARLSLFENRP